MNALMQRLRKARVALLLRQPFFGTIAASLELVIEPTEAGASTDGQSIRVDPDWLGSVSDAELLAVVSELTLHVVLRHHLRRGAREERRWNRAADQAAFHAMQAALMPLRTRVTALPEFRGLAAEAIYQRLPATPSSSSATSRGNAPTQRKSRSAGNGSNTAKAKAAGMQSSGFADAADPLVPDVGQVCDLPKGVDRAAAEQKIKHLVQRAAKTAKRVGTLPGEVECLIRELERPRLQWREHLAHWLQERSRDDYSWRLPNRRFLASGLYMPALDVPAMGGLVFAIDTSGSIDQSTLDEAADEATALVDQLSPSQIHVLHADCKVQSAQAFDRGDELRFRALGGGGTDFRPVFEWTEQHGEPIAGLVYFTDGLGRFPDHPPDCPVFWVIKGAVVPPFGEHVRVD